MSRRTIPLFDPHASPQSWNERMAPGDFAVLYSAQYAPSNSTSGAMGPSGPVCDLFSTFSEAEEHARQETALWPSLRCRIYGAEGLGGPPIKELKGSDYRGDSEMSARFRRWCGATLFVGGLGLILFDSIHDFNRGWPATIGMRAFPAGLILLVTEAVIVWEHKRKQARDGAQ
jgi:hypothetical protein